MRSLISLSFLFFIFFSVYLTLEAQPASETKKECEESAAKKEELKKEMKEKLHLSKEQEQMLEENRKNHREKMKELCEKIKEKRISLNREVQNVQFENEKAIVIHDDLKK